MTDNKKPHTAGTGTASKTTFNGHNTTAPDRLIKGFAQDGIPLDQGACVRTSLPLQTPSSTRKIDRIAASLHRHGGLNRFDAERIGDHCLNSTVSDLRKIYGDRLKQRWEVVPSRYSAKGVRVLCYWLACEVKP